MRDRLSSYARYRYSIQPQKLTFPVFYVATPSGGSQAVGNGPDPYPLSGGTWTQRQNAINVAFGEGAATLAYDGSGSDSCQVFSDVRIDGQQVGGGGQPQTESTTPQTVTQQIGGSRSRANEPEPADAHRPGRL